MSNSLADPFSLQEEQNLSELLCNNAETFAAAGRALA